MTALHRLSVQADRRSAVPAIEDVLLRLARCHNPATGVDLALGTRNASGRCGRFRCEVPNDRLFPMDAANS